MQTDATSANNSQHCWVLLHGQQCCVRLHGPKSLTGFKLYAASANIVVVPCKRTQQVTTLLGPTMLDVVGQQCWVRLHGPLGNRGAHLLHIVTKRKFGIEIGDIHIF